MDDISEKKALDERREVLSSRLEKHRIKTTLHHTKPGLNDATGFGYGLRLGSEFMAAVLVGGGLGWAFDIIFGTSPIGLILFLMLGFAAGVLNVIRTSEKL